MIRLLTVIAFVAWTGALVNGQVPPRDAVARPQTSGTASISGVILTDTPEPVPLRKARVTLSNADIGYNRTIITDETGRFTFAELPAGTFALAVMKEAYGRMAYGARRPGRPGTSINLRDGQAISGLTIRLPKGAVVTGTVTDHLGQPMPGIPISLQRYIFSSTTGQRNLSMAASGRTDDRGVYRLYALPPGEYLVSAAVTRPGPFREEAELVQVSEADLNQILLDAQRSAPGAPDASPEIQGMAPGQAVNYAPLYYPNVVSASQATPLRLSAGDERSGIDFQMSLVPTARVEGAVSMPEGGAPPIVLVTMWPADDSASGTGVRALRSTRVGKDGVFRFASVTPGEYLLMARANDPALPGSNSTLWAAGSVAAGPGATAMVSLELRRGFTVSGRVEFATAETQPPPFKGWRVGLAPDGATGRLSLGLGTAEVQADGSFAIHGLSPGQYRLRGFPPAAVAKSWIVRSAVQNGRDLLDTPITITTDTADITMTFTDRVAGIGGTLQDPTGAPAADYYVIVFPRNPAHWRPQSPRIQAIRPSLDGKYEVGGLPAGDYFLAATTDVEEGEWWDTAFLQRMAASAMAFTLAEGERKVQDLQLSGGR
jgi:hypothetical protein